MSITPAESRIMEALWARGPLSRVGVQNAVAASQSWGAATVRTLIARLLKRGALRSDRVDGRVLYTPLVTRSDYLAAEAQALLDRLFEGRLSSLAAHLAGRGRLTPLEAKKTRKLLKALDGG